MIPKLLVTCIAAATAASAIPAFAQSSNGAQAIEEIEVFSNSRRSEGLADLNSSVAILGQEELNLIKHSHYQEALNRLPGVAVHRNNGQESLMAIRSPVLSGAGACGSFLVAENGIPIRSQGFCNVNEMFDTHTENAASIEVVRGPGSAFWGSNAVHGLINVVLPKAGDAGEVTLEQGPRGSQRIKGAYGNDYGKFKQTILFNGQNEKGYRNDSGVDQQKLSWIYNYTNDNGTEFDGGFTIINLNQETAGFVEGPDAYKDDDLRKTNPNPEAYRDSVNSRVWTAISHRVDDWDLVFTPYWREVNMEFIQHFLPGQPIEDTEHRSLGTQIVGYKELSDGSNLAIGLDVEDTQGSLKQFQPNPTEGSFFLRSTIPQGRHYDYDVDARQFAGFINYDTSYDNGWDVSLGLRLENVSYNYDNKMIDGRTNEFGVPCGLGGCRYNRPSDREDSFTNLSPKLGLSYELNDNHDLQIRVQRGFRAPQATELYRLQNNQSVAELDAVELDSYEVAFKGAGEAWNYTVTAYFMDKENDIITNSDRENLNNSDTKHRGVELSFGVDLTETLALNTVYNVTRHTYENSEISGGIDIKGNIVDTAPRTFGNLRLTWQPISTLLAELEWVNMGDYYTNPENTADYDGHNLANLRVQYQYSDDINLSLNLLNITDVEYAERADWTSFSGDRYFPGEPARAFFAVNWDFK